MIQKYHTLKRVYIALACILTGYIGNLWIGFISATKPPTKIAATKALQHANISSKGVVLANQNQTNPYQLKADAIQTHDSQSYLLERVELSTNPNTDAPITYKAHHGTYTADTIYLEKSVSMETKRYTILSKGATIDTKTKAIKLVGGIELNECKGGLKVRADEAEIDTVGNKAILRGHVYSEFMLE